MLIFISLLVLMMWMWFLDFWKMTLVTQAVDASLTWKIALLFINKPLFTATKARRKNSCLGKNNLGHITRVRLLVVKIIYENWIFVLWFNSSNVRTNVRSNNILSILRVWFGEGGSRTEQSEYSGLGWSNCHYVDLALLIVYDCAPPRISLHVCTPLLTQSGLSDAEL